MTAIPDDLAREIGYETCEASSRTWPRWVDRDTDVWRAAPYTHDGEQIMYPCAGDMEPLVRSEVEALYGPLVPEEQS